MSHRLPRTGSPDVPGLSTDGVLAAFLGIAISGLSLTYSGDDGGWKITVSGTFPTWVGMYVDFIDPTDPTKTYRCYSGVVGQGDVCWSADGGGELVCWHPPMPVGEDYTIRVQATDASSTGSLTAALDIWKRSYTTNLYNIRSHHPPPRAVGALSPRDEVWGVVESGKQGIEGEKVSLWSVVLSAIADTIHETQGFLLSRLAADYTAGATELRIEGAHRWPDEGRMVLNGEVMRYTALSPWFATTPGPTTGHYVELSGLTDDFGDDPVPTGRLGDVVMYLGRDTTDLDDLRNSFFVQYAEGSDLDMLGRQYGIDRPRGMTDTTFRALLQVMFYLPAQGVESLERVLDVVRGPGNYTIYEKFPEPGEYNRVYVEVTAVASDQPRGKSYMVGGEAQATTSTTTVDVDHAPAVVAGIYSSTDPYRTGTNYCEETTTVTETAPDRLVTAAPFWQGSDEGRTVQMASGSLWTVLAVLDPNTAQVGRAWREDGTLNSGSPTEIVASESAFREWMVGHQLVVDSTTGSNAGTYTITSFVDERTVRCSAAAFVTETDVTYRVKPVFTGALVSMKVHRATMAGLTITTPRTMPANVIVDYATTPSAQVMADPGDNGEAQYPLYVFDDTFIVALLLDLITAAGVEPVLETA